MHKLIVLVCGGRYYNKPAQVGHALSALHNKYGIEKIIHGGASGADRCAGQWAKMSNVPVTEFPADWNSEGKAAGPLRNQRMLEEGNPNAVVAFPGGHGTADMCRRAEAAGLKIWRPYG